MTGDRNTFNLGPARIDVDRDFATSLDQTVSRSETIIQQTAGIAELNIGTVNATTKRGDTAGLTTANGTAFSAKNATTQTLQQGDVIIYGKLTNGDYAIIGILSSYTQGSGAGSLINVSISGNDIGACWPAIDVNNVLGYGANTFIYRSSAVANATMYRTPTGASATLNSTRDGYWYGFYQGNLYMCDNPPTAVGGEYSSTLYRYDQSTNTWISVSGIAGIPSITSGALYWSFQNNVRALVGSSTTFVTVCTNMSATTGYAEMFVGNANYQWTWDGSGTTQNGIRRRVTSTSSNSATEIVPRAAAVLYGFNGDPNDPLTLESHSFSTVTSGDHLFNITAGSTSYALTIVTKNGTVVDFDDFMLGTTVGASFDNDPARLVINGVIGITATKVLVVGGYAPTGTTGTFRPAIWSFDCPTLDSSGYNLNMPYDLSYGTGVQAFVFGIHNNGLPAGRFCWMEGTGTSSGPNSIKYGDIT